MLFSELDKIMVNKVTFVGFMGGYRPIAPIDPPLLPAKKPVSANSRRFPHLSRATNFDDRNKYLFWIKILQTVSQDRGWKVYLKETSPVRMTL